jgi:hypothetical protein
MSELLDIQTDSVPVSRYRNEVVFSTQTVSEYPEIEVEMVVLSEQVEIVTLLSDSFAFSTSR